MATLTEAMDTAAAMIAELAGGKVLSGIVSAGSVDTSDVPVTATIDYVNRSLGTNLDYAQIADIFRRLGMKQLAMQVSLQSQYRVVVGTFASQQTW